MGFSISRGIIPSPVRCVITGTEGIGKSTLASKFPSPLFIDTEGSTKQLDVMRFDPPTSWQMLMGEVDAVINDPSLCQTLVIDTIDWAEKLCATAVCEANHWTSLESPGYGAGYRYMYEAFAKLLDKLTLLPPKGVNVVLTAHTALRRVEQPEESGSYDKWELKLQNSQKCSNAAMVKEWADMVLFCNYKTMVITEGNSGKGKAKGGKRVMYTTHKPCWDAKNRFGLPEECEMKYDIIKPFVYIRPDIVPADQAATLSTDTPQADGSPAGDQHGPSGNQPDEGPAKSAPATGRSVMQEKLHQLRLGDGFTEQQVMDAVKYFVGIDAPISDYPDDFISDLISGHWADVRNYIVSQGTEMPF